MKMNRYLILTGLLFIITQAAISQSFTLVSSCNGTFSRNSLFFDLQVTNDLVLDDIAILSQNCGTRDFKVYYKQGTYLGFNSNPAAWTLLDSTQNFTPSCALSCPIPPTVIPVTIKLCLSAGQTYGFYISMTGGTGTIESHNLLPAGSIGAQDANLTLITGEGHNGTTPFNTSGTLTTGLTFEGEFHYHYPDVSLGNDTAICAGDSLLLDAGSAFSTFLWSTGATTQSIYALPGIYTILVDSGTTCQAMDTILINTQACSNVIANLASSDTLFCEKKCLDFFDLSTNSPTSWQWFFPGADSISSNVQNPTNICYNSYGSFDVTLVACNATNCDTLFLPDFIQAFQNPAVPLITSNYDTLFSSPAFSYQWYDTSGAISGAVLSYYVYPTPGSYFVVVTDSNGCASSSAVITTGLMENEADETGFRVMPNPNNGTFLISTPTIGNIRPYTLEITDVSGRIMLSQALAAGNKQVSVSLKVTDAGLYFVRISVANKTWIKKMIVLP